jgi:SsrA-binding protein
MGKGKGDLVSNRRAFHDYEVLETYEAGISLKGTEIKSLRDNGGSLQQSYVKIIRGELWLIGCNIAPYKFGNIHNHPEQRDRKLLVHKRELKAMGIATQEKGLALIPLGMYLKNGWVKVKVAIAKGKKAVDKRQTLKERDELKRMQKAMRNEGF